MNKYKWLIFETLAICLLVLMALPLIIASYKAWLNMFVDAINWVP